MSRAQRIAGQTALLTVANIAGLALNFAGTIFVTRALGPEGRGLYATLLTLVGFAIQVAALASPAAIRAIPDRGRTGLAATLPVLAGLGTVLTLPLLAYGLLDPGIAGPAGRIVYVAWAAVPVTAAGIGFATLVQIEGRPVPVLTARIGPRAIQLGLIGILIALGRLDVGASIGLFTVTACLELAFAVWFATRAKAAVADPRSALQRRMVVVALLRSLGAGWIGSLALFGLPRISLLVLGASAPLDRTGIYSVALTLQEVALVVPVAFGGVLISQSAGTSAGWGSGAVLVAVMALGCAAALPLAPIVVPVLFGPSFGEAAGVFRVLLLGVMCATLHQVCLPELFGRGGRAVAAPALAGFAVATGSAVLTVPALGIDGAVLSNGLGYGTLAILSLALAARRRPA